MQDGISGDRLTGNEAGSGRDFSGCGELLLRWYDRNRRQLPWREEPSPYHVWLSEIMLQQTRVEAVKGYYARFLTALPDIACLAAAEEDLCLKLWEGLGYYSRVRNLRKGAQYILETCGGEMPSTAAELVHVPGIGPYTAAAIASIAFGERIPAVDGNLLRVFARLTAYPESIKEEKAKAAARDFYLQWMPADRPGDFNQALMDLGAGVCLPNAAPACHSCPLSSFCAAHRTSSETAYPVMPEKRARQIEMRTVFLIHDAERIALRKRPSRGLLAGLYEFPNTEGQLSEPDALRYVRSLGFAPLRIRPLEPARHVFTHKEWHMTGYEILADELEPLPESSTQPGSTGVRPESPGPGAVFLAGLDEIHGRYSIPSAFTAYRKILE